MTNNTNKPFVIHAVRKFETPDGPQNHWTRIGAAFPNSKGGFRLKLDLVPTDLSTTDIVVMPPKEDDAE